MGLETAARAFHPPRMQEPSPDPVFFDAVLRPNPPLNPRALVLILAAVGIVNFAFGIGFMLHGAWPIAPFMGADVALLAWAFRASRRAAGTSERLTLTTRELRIERRPARGRSSETTFNPYWVRVELEDDVEPARKLTLSSHGRRVLIGAFLAPQERASLAGALKAALGTARQYRPL